jgi:uncharacterized membrane protein (UPF0127 family)
MMVLWAVLSCFDKGAQATPPEPSASSRPVFRHAKVIVEGTGGPVELNVEVAETDAQRMYGLMFSGPLPDTEGMVFVFPSTAEHGFWMKNTPISLDMVFLGEDRSVTGIYEMAVPFSTAPMGVRAPSRYVLEVRGGWARRHGVHKGTRVRFEGVVP